MPGRDSQYGGGVAGPDPDRERVRAPGLRERTARGGVINSVFLLGLELLRLVRGFVIAGVIAVAEFGLYGILGAFHGVLARLKQVGIGDKFVQQTGPDQERAFQEALTLEIGVNLILSVLICALGPVLALTFDEPRLIPLSFALATVPPAMALQASLWVFYRRMDFLRQRLLQSVDPIVGFGVAVTLAIAGMGVWSIVLGIIAGVWSTALSAVLACPYRLRLRWNPRTARTYASFSWPLLVAASAPLVIAPSTALVGFQAVGMAGVGAITLATSLVQYTNRADQIITGTIYPAICAIQDRPDRLVEVYEKTNRIVLVWALPVGAFLLLFSPELLPGLLGEKWEPAAPLVQAFGMVAAINQISYNWTAFYRARSETRPIAVYAGVGVVLHLAIVLPALALWELDGLAVSIVLTTALTMGVRLRYAARLFPGVGLRPIAGRGLAITAFAMAAALGAGALGVEALAVRIGVFFVALAAVAWVLEGALLRELVGYLRRRAA